MELIAELIGLGAVVIGIFFGLSGSVEEPSAVSELDEDDAGGK